MTREEEILKAGEEITSNQFELEGFIEGAEWADEHPDLYSVTRKAVEREREYLIRKACDWLRGSTILAETTIERFKQAMEEQQ